MLITACEVHDLRDFGLCYLEGKDADNREALFVHRQHDLDRLGVIDLEESFQHEHHEFHWRIVVIEKHHLIHWWLLGLWLGLENGIDTGIGAVVVLVGHYEIKCCHVCALPVGFCDEMLLYRNQVLPEKGVQVKMSQTITTIGFDADDTLWQNEEFFRLTQEQFCGLLSDFADPDHLAERLLQAERRNLGRYGFGIKGFVLSMIETAIEVTDQKIPASVIADIIAAGQEMLEHPIHLLPHAEQAVADLAGRFKLVLITKGDLLDQERKLAQSGLGEMFDAVEIVSDKIPQTYIRAFMRHGDGPERAVMVGNSMKSDVVPAIDAGGWGVHVPAKYEWEIERAEAPVDHPRFRVLNNLSGLVGLVDKISTYAKKPVRH